MTKTTSSTTIEKKQNATLPSVLAYSRSIAPCPGMMYSATLEGAENALSTMSSKELAPVRIDTTTVRGTIANYDKKQPSERIGTGKKDINTANIQSIAIASLLANQDHLVVFFDININANSLEPNQSNSPEFNGKMSEFLQAYNRSMGFEELATRYVLQLLNGSWLWRNREGLDLRVSVQHKSNTLYVLESDIDMRNGWSVKALDASLQQQTQALIADVASALAGTGNPVQLKVAGSVRMGHGAQVYPSQEFSAREDKEVEINALSKQLLEDGSYIATLHARKIGNAIRTIDTWHAQEGVGAIAVEPFGANTFTATAYRQNTNNLYSYLQDPEKMTQEINNCGVQDHHHFVAACLVRGGVYGFGKVEG